ncbi:MAG: NAD-dependent epimerase/dehydratase family protein [Planctomycetota bacterium]|nr:NAD-dependent epimerase/dehydratase family protein [Planctomycetota bacterium]
MNAGGVKTLVTGGGGFLGGAIVERLIARGDSVRCLARGDYPGLRSMGVEVVRGDIADADVVASACRGCDLVFHVAARAGIGGRYDDYHKPNVIGTQNVISGCRAGGVSRLVHTSSPAVVFDGSDMAGVDESVPYALRHHGHYSKTKSIAELAVLAADGPDLSTCALRPHLIWGPRDNQLVPRIINRAKSLRRIGGANPLVDTTYIDNAADAHILAADRLSQGSPASGKAYFISNGEPRPLWDMVNGILAAADLPAVTRSVPIWVAKAVGAVLETTYSVLRLSGEPRMTRFLAAELSTTHWFDISAARRELGYEPGVTLDEGLARLRAWLRSHPGKRAFSAGERADSGTFAKEDVRHG